MTIADTRPIPPVAPGDPRARWTVARVVATALASVALLLGTTLLVAGTVTVIAAGALRGADGFYTRSPTTWSSSGYAALSPDIRLPGGTMMPGLPARMLGTVRLTAHSPSGHALFLGVAPTADVDGYLGHVARTTLRDPWNSAHRRVALDQGGAPAGPPAEATIWVASAGGPGSQTVSWTPRSGHWTVVVMNADGSAPVDARVAVAAQLPGVRAIGIGLLVAGFVVFTAAGIGLVVASPRQRRPSTQGATPPDPPTMTLPLSP